MAAKNQTKTTQELTKLNLELVKVTHELIQTRLEIKAGAQSNTNAHKKLKTKRAQLLQKINQLKPNKQ